MIGALLLLGGCREAGQAYDKVKKMAVRFESDIARHAGKASVAACTAWSTSSTVAKSTAPVWMPFAGL